MKQIFEGKTVLFQGDSVTDCGRNREDPEHLGGGYPSHVAGIWANLFPGHNTRFVNRGVSGDRTSNLLERYEKDFVAVKPDVVSILIGINDVWRRYDRNDPTSPEQFEKNYRTLLENLRRDLKGVFIVIIEPFLLGSDPGKKGYREDLDPKIQVIRSLAITYADAFLPLDGIFARYAVEGRREADMSADGVHPTSVGHGIIAAEWLKLTNESP
ncbi:MAG: SGNH/GDSL hydrolase family protein [Treponema sp.]|jgi:lysophospholipase L1-like esterase|nr:SGNH/GDSL hydrolase family protein [Treponema sp.]